METEPTPSPRPRGARADAETSDTFYLIKNVPALRATYQIRLLAWQAAESGKKLVLMVPPGCRFDTALAGLIGAMGGQIQREDLR